MYTAEYSKSQQAYHVGEEKDLLEKDLNAFVNRGWVGDYEVIGRFETRQEASEFIKNRRKAI